METIRIVGTERKTTKNGKPYLAVSGQGQEFPYSVWNAGLWPLLEGKSVATVEIEVSADGRFKHITAVSASAGQSPASGAPIVGAGSGRERNITRAVALKAAVDALAQNPPVADGDQPGTAPASELRTYMTRILFLADGFTAWLERDPDDVPF